MTNAERIRQMTNEELAHFITSDTGPIFEDAVCPPIGRCSYMDDCEDCWVKWLEQEAET